MNKLFKCTIYLSVTNNKAGVNFIPTEMKGRALHAVSMKNFEKLSTTFLFTLIQCLKATNSDIETVVQKKAIQKV